MNGGGGIRRRAEWSWSAIARERRERLRLMGRDHIRQILRKHFQKKEKVNWKKEGF